MFYLSFDIGIKNLAYCYSENERILEWNVLNVESKDIHTMSELCVSLLYNTFVDKEIDIILIENQPVQKNPTMKSVQMIVYTFFCVRKVLNSDDFTILFQSANNKNKYMNKLNIQSPKCSTKYLENKKKAIICVKQIIDSEWYDIFICNKKKDDLADSYLQTLAYINYTPVLPNPLVPLSDSSNE
jgi:hypothetical protein